MDNIVNKIINSITPISSSKQTKEPIHRNKKTMDKGTTEKGTDKGTDKGTTDKGTDKGTTEKGTDKGTDKGTKTNEKINNGLFIFRRDLRIQDNHGLIEAVSRCNTVYPVFIFTPEQTSASANKYRSANAIQFMIESLDDLQREIHKKGGTLGIFYGHNKTIVERIISQYKIDAVFFNKDITPYAVKRDEELAKLMPLGRVFACDTDYYLLPPKSVVSAGSGNVYEKFTPYYEKILYDGLKHIPRPQYLKTYKFASLGTFGNYDLRTAYVSLIEPNPNLLLSGGRSEALSRIQSRALRPHANYKKNHNMLHIPTTQLSAYIKFGCVSIREVFYAIKTAQGIGSDIIRQLVWRDFYANLLYEHPSVLGRALKPVYNRVNWRHNAGYLDAWKRGETGFPIVDAGMRQLNTVGYMHNRARLIVASFLVKTLLLDWREGEKYFATQLLDYDPASNNGNWQWVAGTGADSQPYFRIFNPWNQSENYDNDAEYIKTWIPALKDVPAKHIHEWYKYGEQHPEVASTYITKPIVVYETQRDKALDMYKSAFS